MAASDNVVSVAAVAGAGDVEDCRVLFSRYFDWIQSTYRISLEFQNIEGELGGLPGAYARPDGEMFLARTTGGRPAGCIAFRRHSAETCEIKRLYVLPEMRGGGIGHRLAGLAIDTARARGYRQAVLDTLEAMSGARRLYADLGFVEIAPYYDNPLPGARYLGRDL